MVNFVHIVLSIKYLLLHLVINSKPIPNFPLTFKKKEEFCEAVPRVPATLRESIGQNFESGPWSRISREPRQDLARLVLQIKQLLLHSVSKPKQLLLHSVSKPRTNARKHQIERSSCENARLAYEKIEEFC